MLQRQIRTHGRDKFQLIVRHLIAVFIVLFSNYAFAIDPGEGAQLLKKADGIKTSDNSQFLTIIHALDLQSDALSTADAEYLDYLKSWQNVYEGEYETAIAKLNFLINDAHDVTVQFRARATLINVLVLATQYENAFGQLSILLEQLPRVQDKDVREQALVVAALMYNKVGQYDLGTKYADQIIHENWAGRGACKGGQLQVEAQYKSGLVSNAAQFQSVIDACNNLHELVHANVVRAYLARWRIGQGRYEEAITLLKNDYEEVKQIRSPRITSEFESLLAQAYRQTGNVAMARQFANLAVDGAVKGEYTEPLVSAYRLLYLLSKEQGDTRLALAFHEKYATADKGYLDDVTARQLAYQRVKHELDASHLQIEALNKQNQVLQLQRELSNKAVENVRLYIVLLTMCLAFIALWAYKTKRSQLHFMKLSRQDGLTGIFNRPHFIEQANQVLESDKKNGQHTSIVICDLDHFKMINDSWGHATGDSVLKRTAAAFSANLRKDDIVGRLGGEEFGIVFTNCDSLVARQRCEQMRLALTEISISEENKLTASFGVADTASSGHDFRQLLAHADAALYRAKRSGRNKVVLHGAPEEAATTIAAERLRA